MSKLCSHARFQAASPSEYPLTVLRKSYLCCIVPFYLPFHWGLRFSAKAFGPSLESSVVSSASYMW